eukprot:SAG11_NODE_11765_length_739_cov_1.106250_1_plen_209_part_10
MTPQVPEAFIDYFGLRSDVACAPPSHRDGGETGGGRRGDRPARRAARLSTVVAGEGARNRGRMESVAAFRPPPSLGSPLDSSDASASSIEIEAELRHQPQPAALGESFLRAGPLTPRPTIRSPTPRAAVALQQHARKEEKLQLALALSASEAMDKSTTDQVVGELMTLEGREGIVYVDNAIDDISTMPSHAQLVDALPLLPGVDAMFWL